MQLLTPMIRTALVVLHMCCAHMFHMCFACIPHTHMCCLTCDLCLTSAFRLFRLCFDCVSFMFWFYFTYVFSYVLLTFHECHTDESHMFCLCFTYVLLVLYIRFYFRVMARWLKILVTNDWTYAVHVPKGSKRNSWNSQVWTVIHQQPFFFTG